MFLSGSKLTGKTHQCWCKIQCGLHSSWLRLFKHLWHTAAQHKLLVSWMKPAAAEHRGFPRCSSAALPSTPHCHAKCESWKNIVSLSACLFAWCISFESTSIFSKCKNEQLVIPGKQQFCRGPLPPPERQTSLRYTRAHAAHFSLAVHTTKYSVLQNKRV